VDQAVITQAELLTIAGTDKNLDDDETQILIEKIDLLHLPVDVIKIVFVAKPVTRDATLNGPGILGQNQIGLGRGDIALCFLRPLADPPAAAQKYGGSAAHECGHSLRGADHRETGGIFDPAVNNTSDYLPNWHLMCAGKTPDGVVPEVISSFIIINDPPRSAKHWYLRDEDIIHSKNNFSKKIP
jgi:hypothetical protein